MMKYTCTCYHGLTVNDQIRPASVTRREGWIEITYREDGYEQCLHATSDDGMNYEGHYYYCGYNVEEGGNGDTRRRVRFTMYAAADGRVLLVGRWFNTESGKAGDWIFGLDPTVSG